MSSALVSDDQQSWVCIVDDVQSDTTRLDVELSCVALYRALTLSVPHYFLIVAKLVYRSV